MYFIKSINLHSSGLQMKKMKAMLVLNKSNLITTMNIADFI